MINNVVLVGRLTKDPEFRVTPSGVQVANFTLAMNRKFTNQNGEREADFINCIVFRKIAENVNQYLSKGSLAGVNGRLQSRSYENKDGQRIFVTEVVCDSVQFLEPKSSQNSENSYQNSSYYQNTSNTYQRGQNVQKTQNEPNNVNQNNPFANADGPIDLNDDDLPF